MSASKYLEKGPPPESVATDPSTGTDDDVGQSTPIEISSGSQALHRKLRGKEVQLFAIGGAIGTCKLTSFFASLYQHTAVIIIPSLPSSHMQD